MYLAWVGINDLDLLERRARTFCRIPRPWIQVHLYIPVIEEWFIQKRRQRSSLLLGGQSCFNSLPRNSYFAPGRVEESAKFAPYSSTRPGSSLEYESIHAVHLLSVQAYCFLSVMNSLTDRNMRKSQQLGERKVGGKAIDIAWVNIKKNVFIFII